jgi:hypothetical protein
MVREVYPTGPTAIAIQSQKPLFPGRYVAILAHLRKCIGEQ